MRMHSFCWWALGVLVLLVGSVPAEQPSCRDQNLWPFDNTTIWNVPIGSGAVFVLANIYASQLPNNFFSDDDYFVATSASDPLVPWYSQGWWGQPNGTAHCDVKGPLVDHVHFPEDVNITGFGNDNSGAILLPDNRTIINTQPLYRCSPGSPVLSIQLTGVAATADIRGNGNWGAHGGSSLSSIGGTIRLGELLPDSPPIRHALKLELWAHVYYYGVPPGYLWPALNCDGYAFKNCDPNFSCYNGTNKFISPGALLAIPANVSATINVTTVPAAKLLWTLTHYGGYIVDDTAVNRGTFCTEHGVTDEFQAAYGFAFNTWKGTMWYDDLLAIFRGLHIVANNSPNNLGGGGVPGQPLPPPFCE